MLENKFVRSLLFFFLCFTRCSTHGLVHGSTHGIRSWFYLQFLRMVSSRGSTHRLFLWFYSWYTFMVLEVSSYGFVHDSTLVSSDDGSANGPSYGFCPWFNSCSLFVVLQWFCSCSWFNSRSLLWFLPLVSFYGTSDDL